MTEQNYHEQLAAAQTTDTSLQQEITHEVNTDAQHLATSVFGKIGNMPDVQRLPDDVIDARYRQAYQNQDRQWLTQEAQRDPEQFTKVARRIGVLLPEEIPEPPAPPAPAPTAESSMVPPAMLPQPSPVVAAPAPLPPPPGAVPAPAMMPPPGVSLGGVAEPAQPVPLTAPTVTQGF